jgi:hypothetical protein
MPYSFVGATTPWETRTGTATSTFGPLERIDANANSTAFDIAAKVGALRAQAEGYASEAYANINACMSFSDSVSKVTFTAPEFQSADLQNTSVSEPPDIDPAPRSNDLSSFNPTTNTGSFASGTASAPSVGVLPDMPDMGLAGSYGAPIAPGAMSVTIPTPPRVSFDPIDVASPTPPSAPSIPDTDIEIVELLPFPEIPPMDAGDLDAALSALKSLLSKRITIPQPALKFPLIFDVVGQLLSGDLVVDSDAIVRQSDARIEAASDLHDRQMARLWADRGFDHQPAIDTYNAVMRAKADADRAYNNIATQGRWTQEALMAAYEVGVAAHGMMIDLTIAMDEIEYEALLATAESQLELAKASVAAYNGAAQMYRIQAAALEASYADAMAQASAFRSRVRIEESKERMNAATAEGFAATESIKRTQVKLFDTQVSINESKVRSFISEMNALAQRARVLNEIDLEQYKARVLTWTAEVESIKGQIAQARNKARTVAIQNEAIVAQVRSGQAANDVVAANARQIAIETSAKANELRAAIQTRSARYAEVEAKNMNESVTPDITASKYEGDVTKWAATLDQETGLLEGNASEMSAAARFFVSVSESQSRAAQISQQAQQQLAEAIRTAADAAGRAGAAVESGRLSGYRASATLSARASLSADQGYSLTASDGYTDSVTQSDTRTDKVTVESGG